jgi:hypothetical protein
MTFSADMSRSIKTLGGNRANNKIIAEIEIYLPPPPQ